MRDLFFVFFILGLLGLGLRRPFLFVLAYAYVDIIAPQRLSYYMLNAVPLSMIVAGVAMAGWLLADDKKHFRVTPRQWLMTVLLLYAGVTTLYADEPVFAAEKWDWAWKSIAWAIFLPFTLRTRLRIEAYLLFMTLSAAAIIIVGGIKTLLSGGGYGVLNLMLDINMGLYESSTASTFAIAIIPVILWLAKSGTIFPPDWRVKLFAYALIFACLLIPVGTEARTGLVCIFVLVLLLLRDVKRRVPYLVFVSFVGIVSAPFLPQTFTNRMDTISGYEADSSATTRLAVWEWTWNYALDHPLGGGFDAYRQNRLRVTTTTTSTVGSVQIIDTKLAEDKGRAYHSSYFEMLGEQGFPGLILFLLIHGVGLVRMEKLRRLYRGEEGERAWISPLATALQGAHIIYLVGSLFIGIAYQPFMFMLLGVQIGFDAYVSRRAQEEQRTRFMTKPPSTQPARA